MPPDTDYMDRNDRLVEYCVSRAQRAILPQRRDEPGQFSLVLKALAFPKERKEVQRSGTWSTIRRFRRAGIDPMIFPLEGH